MGKPALLDKARCSGLQVARSVNGREITYVRDSDELRFNALPGSTDWETEASGYVTNAWQSYDFLFPVVELTSLDPDRPDRGDYITERLDDGTVLRYDVLPESGLQPWKYVPATGRKWVRVHTKLVSES